LLNSTVYISISVCAVQIKVKDKRNCKSQWEV
jgi:hypothetical protein